MSANPDSSLPFGVYETPITARIRERMNETLSQHPAAGFGIGRSSDEEAHGRYTSAVSQHIGSLLERRLYGLKSPEDRVALINNIALLLGEDEEIDSEELLYAVYNSGLAEPPLLPDVSLTKSALFTNAQGESSLTSEIEREIKTADSVDLLCAFIKNSGISVLDRQLEYLRDNEIPFRLLTSTYCGASDAAALERLVEKYQAEVKICYEHKSTRLHAKAWLFRRKSGFDTAFIGSSNLSRSALVDGWEWNVRGSNTATPEVIDKFIKTFDSYWHDSHFKTFDPNRDMERLERSLRVAKGGENSGALRQLELSGLEVTPYPYQEEMLEALRSEREVKDRHRNLLVAATGTGKTVVAALDYRNLCEQWKRRPRLLFVAHRKEILQQARRTFQEVLKDADFGELLVDGAQPRRWDYVFASVQSLSASRLQNLNSKHFDAVVIDEFHHAQAPTYKALLDHLQPQELLGLTATPERGDGENVQKYFDYRVAHELRLWDALRLQLLVPMHYYGIADGTDLSSLTWSRGKKDYNTEELSEFYIKAGEKRTRFIVNELNRRIFDLSDMKAIGFCVTIAHAEYMAQQFQQFGIPARAVTSNLTATGRAQAIKDLETGDVRVLFSVDIFNEGVDIPAVNTLLLLRPTQSPVVFLQQLGRGLRLSPGKDSCVILDFIGQQHVDFDFERKFHALTRKRGKRLAEEIEQGFPTTPPGSHIQFDQTTTEQVLRNVKKVSRNSLRKVRALLSEIRTTNLKEFLEDSNLQLEDIYRPSKYSWTRLLREEGLLQQNTDETESFLLNRIRVFLHVNDPHRIDAYLRILSSSNLRYSDMGPSDQAFTRMLVLGFWANSNSPHPGSYDAALTILRQHPQVAWELEQVMQLSSDSSRIVPQHSDSSVLETHADYSLAELIGALESGSLQQLVNLPREGVKYFPDINTDLFLVTFQKDEQVSASTNYRDYPISPDLLHWESQSTTTLKSKAARRYIGHQERDGKILIASRFTKKNEVGTASAYTYLGAVDYVSHHGEKPIQFEWKLQRSMPKALYAAGRTVA